MAKYKIKKKSSDLGSDPTKVITIPKESKVIPKTSDNDVLSYELILESRAVKQALELLPDLKKPASDLKDYLNKLGGIPDSSDHTLEKYLAVFSHWHSYYEVQLELASVVKAVANEQKKKFFKIAVGNIAGKINITEKKEMAYTDPLHLESVDVLQECDSRYNAIQTMVNACERGYKTVSRIVSIREKLP